MTWEQQQAQGSRQAGTAAQQDRSRQHVRRAVTASTSVTGELPGWE